MEKKMICFLLFPVVFGAIIFKLMIASHFAYIDENNRIKFDKLEVLEQSAENNKDCEIISFNDYVPHDAEDVVYYKDDIIILSSSQLKEGLEFGIHHAKRQGGIYIFDAKKKIILPAEFEAFLPPNTGFVAHGMYYSDETQRLYVINHFGKTTETTVEVFSVSPKPNSEYPIFNRLGSIKAGFGFGMLNDIVEASPTEIYVTQWRSTSVPKNGIKGDVSFAAKWTEAKSLFGFLSSYFYNTGFLYCRFNVTDLGNDQQCIKASTDVRFGMANGITINKQAAKDYNLLYVNDLGAAVLQVFKIPKTIKTSSFHQKNAIRNQIEHIDTISLVETVDNIEYDNVRKIITAGGVPAIYPHLMYTQGQDATTAVPGSMIVINPTTKESKRIMYHNGKQLKATSSCIYTSRTTYDQIVCGSPYDHGLLVCKV